MNCLLYLVIGIPVVTAWVNQYDQEFTFKCPEGQYISGIHSVHNNHYEDRQWQFYCREAPGKTDLASCSWSNYQNDFDQLLDFHCPGNSLIHGISSIHNNHFEDRRFNFYCCEVPACSPLSGCHKSAYANHYDGLLNYTVDSGYVLYGADSAHNNHYEDRIWKFEVCPCSEAGLVG